MTERVKNQNSPTPAKVAGPVWLRLFGTFSLILPDGHDLPITSKKNRALLAILALSPGGQAKRDRLCELLWGDRGDEQARSSLRQSFAVMRKELGEAEPLVLQTREDIILLRIPGVNVDTVEFLGLSKLSDAASLRKASELYSGEFLADTSVRDPAFEDWLAAARRRLENQAIGVFEKLTELETGQDLISIAKRLVELDPLRESSHRTLMDAYYKVGENGLALRQYEICKNLLKTELDVEPARQTQELKQKIAEKPTVLKAAAKDIENVPPISNTTNRYSIAVLPFINLSGDPGQDYFSDGITEDINTELSRYHSLSVVARNSSFQFRGPGVDLSDVRRVLEVRYIVNGSIQKAGARVRVTAQLIDAETGSQLWTERYDRTISDVFAVQDEVVQTIVSTLEGRLAASGAARVRAKPTTSWVAYDYFLQGRDLSNRYKIAEADEFLARAVELDPGYVQAHAWRASTLVAKYWYDWNPETLQQAVVCAEQALSLDDSDAWSHQAMGFVSLYTNKLSLAGMHFERAMNLNPNDVNIAADYANWLCYMGRLEEALRYLDMAMQRNPFPPSWMWEIRGTVLLQSKRYEEAISALHKMHIVNYFTHALLAAAYAFAGQAENAGREVALALAGKPNLTASHLGRFPWVDEAHREHILDGFRLAGLPE
jgi:TolB-like protein/DNA-binding SARP family transcriptional activator/Flp pilus assembly protein TadD